KDGKTISGPPCSAGLVPVPAPVRGRLQQERGWSEAVCFWVIVSRTGRREGNNGAIVKLGELSCQGNHATNFGVVWSNCVGYSASAEYAESITNEEWTVFDEPRSAPETFASSVFPVHPFSDTKSAFPFCPVRRIVRVTEVASFA